MTRRILRSFALCAGAALLLGAGEATAERFEIPMGPVSAARAAPVRLAAADLVGRIVFSRQYNARIVDALPGRTSIFHEEQLLPLEDWLREWGAVQIHEIGRPY